MKIELSVEGMHCGGCENRIKNAVGMLNGVNSVTANHETGEVVIEASEEFNVNEAIETIKDLDFEVIE